MPHTCSTMNFVSAGLAIRARLGESVHSGWCTMAIRGFMRVSVVAGAVLAATIVAGCTQEESPSSVPVSREQSEDLLARATGFVQSGELSELCQLSGYQETSSCEQRSSDLLTSAIGTPEVVGFRAYEATSRSHAEAVLEVCTVVDGVPVYSEFYVVREGDGELVAPHPAFWQPRRIQRPEGTMVAVADNSAADNSRCAARG